MRHLIPGLFWAFSFLIVTQPLCSQHVGQSESILVQSDSGERLSLEISCNPRNLDDPSEILIDIDGLDGIYDLIGYGFTGEVSVLGGIAHHFATSYGSIYLEPIPKATVLEAVRDGIRLKQHELILRVTGTSTGYRIERRYPQGVTNICAFMAALCGDRDYTLACGSSYVKSDADVLVQKLKQLLIEYEAPAAVVVVNPPVALPPAIP